MSSRDYRKKIIRLVVIGAVLVLLESAAVFWLHVSISKKTADIRVKQALAVGSKKERMELLASSRDYERVKDFMPKLVSVFPSADTLYTLINQMENIAVRTGNKQTILIEDQAPKDSGMPGVSYVSFSADMSGSYGTFRSYFQEINRAPFLVRFDSFNISSLSDINGESRIVFTGRIFLR